MQRFYGVRSTVQKDISEKKYLKSIYVLYTHYTDRPGAGNMYTHIRTGKEKGFPSCLPLSLSLSLEKLLSALLCQKLVCFQVSPRVLTIVLTTSEAVLNLPRQYEGNLARA